MIWGGRTVWESNPVDSQQWYGMLFVADRVLSVFFNDLFEKKVWKPLLIKFKLSTKQKCSRLGYVFLFQSYKLKWFFIILHKGVVDRREPLPPQHTAILLKGQSSEIFDLQIFFIIRTSLRHWPMKIFWILVKFSPSYSNFSESPRSIILQRSMILRSMILCNMILRSMILRNMILRSMICAVDLPQYHAVGSRVTFLDPI